MDGRRTRAARDESYGDAGVTDGCGHSLCYGYKNESVASARGASGKIGDVEMYTVVGLAVDQTPVRLYFDEKTGLLTRLIRYTPTAFGRLPTQIDYADYRDVDGVKVPFRWTLARVNGRFTIQIDTAQQNVPIDDAKFAMPAAGAAGQGGPQH